MKSESQVKQRPPPHLPQNENPSIKRAHTKKNPQQQQQTIEDEFSEMNGGHAQCEISMFRPHGISAAWKIAYMQTARHGSSRDVQLYIKQTAEQKLKKKTNFWCIFLLFTIQLMCAMHSNSDFALLFSAVVPAVHRVHRVRVSECNTNCSYGNEVTYIARHF